MEQHWGLDLDMSAVRLLRRKGDVWSEIAVEKIDSPDIEDRLTAMLAQIDPGAEVELFLPSDQILCTEVDLPPVGDTRAEIERAMDGQTPYALDELALDWELISSGRAAVAAIALETLDEAAAFADVRGIGVSGYSSLGISDVFPRMPRFEGPHVPSTSAPVEPVESPSEEEVMFASARRPTRPPTEPVASPEPPVVAKAEPPSTPAPDTLILKPEPGASIEVPDGPVIQVDDDLPVMAVKSPDQPLDPGIPIAAPNAPPRVRTDIAASTVSGSAASLTPPGAVHVRRGNSFGATAMIFAAVFVLTLGIATLVWMLLPLSPGRTDPQALPSTASGQNETTAPATEIAAIPPRPRPAAEQEPQDAPLVVEEVDPVDPTPEVAEPTPELEVVDESETQAPDDEPLVITEDAPVETPDLPQPNLVAEPEDLALPSPEEDPTLLALVDPKPQATLQTLGGAVSEGALPSYDPAPPLPVAPSTFATIQIRAPFPGPAPDVVETTEDIYIASVESSDLAADAIALPSVFSLTKDALPDVSSAPALAPEEVPKPDVTSLVPADRQVPQEDLDDAMAAAVAEALADALAGPGGLVPTKLATSVPDRAPRARPGGFVETIERDQFGGRTRQELATLRPPPRPASVQSEAAAASAPPSELAVDTSSNPRERPDNFSALVAAAQVQREAERLRAAAANTNAPDTSSAIRAALDDNVQPQQQPRRLNIPTTASVARQATIEDAIRLNRVNLVGVYGSTSDRRALVRLPSGRFIKVKVGDRVDGGTVAQITDSQLLYRKGNRTLSLSMPQG